MKKLPVGASGVAAENRAANRMAAAVAKDAAKDSLGPLSAPASTITPVVLAGAYLAIIPPFLGVIRKQLNSDPKVQIRLGQFRMMFVLFQGHANTASEAAGTLGITLPAASKMALELEALNLLSRATDRVDRRRTLLSLTPAGRAVFQRAFNSIRQHLAGMFETMSPTDREVLFCAAGKLAEIFQPTANVPHKEKRIVRSSPSEPA